MNSVSSKLMLPSTKSATLAINESVKDLWRQGKNIYHFAFGESRLPLNPRLLQAIQSNVSQKSYLDCSGLEKLRDRIAVFQNHFFDSKFSGEQVVVGPGSKSLLYAIFLSLQCNLFLPTPSWVSYAPQAKLARLPFKYLKSSYDSGYEVTVDALKEAVSKVKNNRQNVLIINSPNNPTGKVFRKDKLKEIADFCRCNDIIVISDEIYALTTYDLNSFCSISEYYPEGTIVVSGPSKHLSIGGWRLGYAITPMSKIGYQLNARLKAVASEIWSSVASPVQFAGAVAYDVDSDIPNYINTCTKFHFQKTHLLYNQFKKLGIRCTQPAGAFYFIANFDHWQELLAPIGVETSVDLAGFLLKNCDVATLPGSSFGTHPNELSLRIASSFVDMESDEKSQRLLSRFLENNLKIEYSDLPNTIAAMDRLQEFAAMIQKGKIERYLSSPER